MVSPATMVRNHLHDLFLRLRSDHEVAVPAQIAAAIEFMDLQWYCHLFHLPSKPSYLDEESPGKDLRTGRMTGALLKKLPFTL